MGLTVRLFAIYIATYAVMAAITQWGLLTVLAVLYVIGRVLTIGAHHSERHSIYRSDQYGPLSGVE